MKINHEPSFESSLNELKEKYGNNLERTGGLNLLMPSEPLTSSDRKLMAAQQVGNHAVTLLNPEIQLFGTGYVNRYGEHSNSLLTSKRNWRVLEKLQKFPDLNLYNHHYYLFVIDDTDNYMDIIEVKKYESLAESFGVLYNNDGIDTKNPGDMIFNGDIIRKSLSFDEYKHYRRGVNLNSMYISSAKITEDPVIISEDAAKKMSSCNIHIIDISINDNHIPLNLFGNDNIYKIFPNIGESFSGPVCAIRKECKETSLFTQSVNNLKTPLMSDQVYKLDGSGVVIDVDIFNNKSTNDFTQFESQLKFYTDMDIDLCRKTVDLLRDYIDNPAYTKSYKLSEFYTICEKKLNGVQYINSNNKVFGNMILRLTVYCKNEVSVGDKVANCYGGKGVITEIVSNEQMPVDSDGFKADILWVQATCINRLNLSQLVEVSVNHTSRKLLHYLSNEVFDVYQTVDMLLKYIRMLSPNQADELEATLAKYPDEDMYDIVTSILTESQDGIYIVTQPISESVDFDTLKKIYQEFEFIRPEKKVVPLTGSDGQVRYVETRKCSIIGAEYTYVMKQHAKEKFSGTALSSTNIRGENSKSKDMKMFLEPVATTPQKVGDMEGQIFLHMGAEVYIQDMLMVYSTSPQARRDSAQMLYNNPHDMTVKMDISCKSRSVEKFNATMKTAGLRLKFSKKKKVRIPISSKIPVVPLSQKIPIRQLSSKIPVVQLSQKIKVVNLSQKLIPLSSKIRRSE